MRGPYPRDEKIKYVKLVLEEGYTLHDIEKLFGIYRTTLRQWIKRYKVGGVKALRTPKEVRQDIPKLSKRPSEIEKLKYENLMLRIEMERMKRGYDKRDIKLVKKKK